MINRVVLIVLDSAGVGFLPDAEEYGDMGANTMGHIGEAYGLNLPNMEKMGLGNIININGVKPLNECIAAYGKAASKSKGKDTTIGHWEIVGIVLDTPLPTFPKGFPDDIIAEFEKRIGMKTIGNKASSGTEILYELGEEHVKTGFPIVYTSADSVFQIAAHEDIIPMEKLYDLCKAAREMFDETGIKVGRVIARPFKGDAKDYYRTANRHDYSLKPSDNIMTDIAKAGMEVAAVGKINDIFAGIGVTKHISTKSNQDGIDKTIEFIKKFNKGLIFTNLVDFDMKYGHRRDAKGYKEALEYFDSRLGDIIEYMTKEDVLIITADHGCDPIFKGTDHTREYIPILVFGKNIKSSDIGIRESFADIGMTVLELLTGEKREGSFAGKFSEAKVEVENE